ncbi:MAG: S8 family serine peptidase [Kiritimatiellales bacterium]|nr:S8 family serine peptidase [Kiritimatiellales bacterium]
MKRKWYFSTKWLALVGAMLFPLVATSATLRLEGDRAWLAAESVPLSRVLELFEQRGVEVMVYPALQSKRISGNWENTKVDRLIQQIASPHSYLLEWKNMPSPLGELYQIASIRIFSDGNPSAAQPLSANRKVLDVVEGTNGVSYIRGEIMVGFGKGSSIDDLNALLRELGGTIVEVINPPGIYRIKLNDDMSVEDAMALALAHDGVEAAEPNLAFPRVESQPVDFSGSNEGINLHLQPGETAVAVFDSGLDPQYADLPFIRGTYNALDPFEAMSDPLGHGTLTAMVAAGAITPLGADAAETGVPVLAVRTFDENGYTSSDVLMRALTYAANSGVKIINMSWGSEVDSRFMESAMNYAAQNGITLYASAGNLPTGIPIYPAGYDSVIAVGGLDPSGKQWDQSNFGAFVKLYEPAFAVFNGKMYRGTSISSPYAVFKAAQQK